MKEDQRFEEVSVRIRLSLLAVSLTSWAVVGAHFLLYKGPAPWWLFGVGWGALALSMLFRVPPSVKP